MTERRLYCGIDVHKESFVGCITDEKGIPIRQHKFPPTKEGVEHFVAGISSAEITIAIEACGLWRAAYKLLHEMGYTVKLANPVKTNQIACKKKTDKVDAQILANLLRTNYLPEVYIPDENTLQLRDITRHKTRITRMRTQIQNRIKAHLLQNGIDYPKQMWNRKQLKKFEDLENLHLNDLIDTYKYFEKRQKHILKKIEELANKNQMAKLLMTHPGIGAFGALMMIAEIGDIDRFRYTKQLISYAGHAPGIYQTGNTSFAVKNTAVNKWLKWIVGECSGRAAQFDPNYKRTFNEVKKEKGFKIARREIARKMLRTVYFMLKNEEEYHAS